jgi:hypothetical protein
MTGRRTRLRTRLRATAAAMLKAFSPPVFKAFSPRAPKGLAAMAFKVSTFLVLKQLLADPGVGKTVNARIISVRFTIIVFVIRHSRSAVIAGVITRATAQRDQENRQEQPVHLTLLNRASHWVEAEFAAAVPVSEWACGLRASGPSPAVFRGRGAAVTLAEPKWPDLTKK